MGSIPAPSSCSRRRISAWLRSRPATNSPSNKIAAASATTSTVIGHPLAADAISGHRGRSRAPPRYAGGALIRRRVVPQGGGPAHPRPDPIRGHATHHPADNRPAAGDMSVALPVTEHVPTHPALVTRPAGRMRPAAPAAARTEPGPAAPTPARRVAVDVVAGAGATARAAVVRAVSPPPTADKRPGRTAVVPAVDGAAERAITARRCVVRPADHRGRGALAEQEPLRVDGYGGRSHRRTHQETAPARLPREHRHDPVDQPSTHPAPDSDRRDVGPMAADTFARSVNVR